jgi:hypothetical protein
MPISRIFTLAAWLWLLFSGCSSEDPPRLFRARTPGQTGIMFENNLTESEELLQRGGRGRRRHRQ